LAVDCHNSGTRRGRCKRSDRKTPAQSRTRAEGEGKMIKPRRALNPLGSRQTIAETQAAPEFRENLKRLKAERLAREAGLKAEGK